MNNSEEDKIRNANKETRRQESVGDQLRTIQEIENDFGRWHREISEMMEIGSHFQNNRTPTLMKRRWGDVEMGGANHHRRLRRGC